MSVESPLQVLPLVLGKRYLSGVGSDTVPNIFNEDDSLGNAKALDSQVS